MFMSEIAKFMYSIAKLTTRSVRVCVVSEPNICRMYHNQQSKQSKMFGEKKNNRKCKEKTLLFFVRDKKKIIFSYMLKGAKFSTIRIFYLRKKNLELESYR